MNFKILFQDKTLKPKERTEQLSQWLCQHPNQSDLLIEFAQSSKDPIKAGCLEAMEYATKENPAVCSSRFFDFACESLAEKSPAVKRESARLIGNTAGRFPKQLEKALTGLLNNSEHEGTVVRWSAAFAIGEILKLKTGLNKELVPVAEAICEREEKNSIQKIYLSAIKKASVK